MKITSKLCPPSVHCLSLSPKSARTAEIPHLSLKFSLILCRSSSHLELHMLGTRLAISLQHQSYSSSSYPCFSPTSLILFSNTQDENRINLYFSSPFYFQSLLVKNSNLLPRLLHWPLKCFFPCL